MSATTTTHEAKEEQRLCYRISFESVKSIQEVHCILHSLGALLFPESATEERELDCDGITGLAMLFRLLGRQLEQVEKEI